MPTNAELTTQVNDLTELVNSIISASKNITDLTAQTPIVNTSEIPVAGDEKITVQQIIDESQIGTVVVTKPVIIPFDFPLNNKTDLDSLHGAIHETGNQSGIILNSGQTITDTIGISKILFVVLAGTDLSGNITITGTSVDRDTGVETGSDTDVVSIDGLSTHSTATDANGNHIHGLTNGYISSKWFKGALTLSTTEVDLTDIEIHQVAFEQFNDCPDITVETIDLTYKITNTAAALDCYLYAVEVTGSIVSIELLATLTHVAGQSVNFYRKRIGNIGKSLDGTTDCIFVDLFLLPTNLTYFASFTSKVWGLESETINVTY